MRLPLPIQGPTGGEMTPENGFRDSWAWTRTFCIGGFVWCVGIASWMALFGPVNDHTDKRIIEFMSLAGILAGLYMAGARFDGYSRRQATVAYETTKMQVSATRASDLSDAAG